MAQNSGRSAAIAVEAKVAGALHIFLGLAFGASVPFVLAFYARNGYLPMAFGFRSLAGGPFEAAAPEAFIALGAVLVIGSVVSIGAGVLLLRGRRSGAYLGLAADPVLFAMGWGFAFLFSSSACRFAPSWLWRHCADCASTAPSRCLTPSIGGR